jgi:two-component system NtrC family sensor kinase
VLSLLAVAAVPLVGVGLYTNHSNTQVLRQLALSATRDRVLLQARKTDELLAEIRGDVLFLTRSPALLDRLQGGRLPQDEGDGALGRQFLSFTGSKPIYASLAYVDEQGREVVRVRHDGLRSWLVPATQLQQHGDEAVEGAPGVLTVEALPRQAGGAPEPVVRYSAPVLDRNDRRRGRIVADVFTRRIVDAVRDAAVQGDDGSTWLLDGRDRAISPAGGAPPPPPEGNLQDVRQRLRGGASTVIQSSDGGTVSWARVRPVEGTPDSDARQEWLLVEWAPEREAFAEVRRARGILAALVVAVSFVAVGLSLLLARRIADPLDTLARGARRLADGDLAHRLDVRTGDELEQLADEFNRMGAALEESYHRLEEREADKSQRLETVSLQLLESERLAAVGRLAAGVAHEINNPVGVMSMYVEQLLEGEGLTQAQRDKLRIVERHTERLARVTGGLLDFARAREYRVARFDAAAPARHAIEALAPRLQEAGVEAHVRADEEVFVDGDEGQVQQVLENLVLNAIHAAPGGRIDIDVQRADDRARLRVRDNGTGIAPEHLERLFEPFFTTKEVGQGTGLGLSISYGIVKAHGGSMAGRTRDEGGAEFTIDLPLAAEAG